MTGGANVKERSGGMGVGSLAHEGTTSTRLANLAFKYRQRDRDRDRERQSL